MNIPEPLSLIMVPLMIFFARILDVTFGTLRIIYISRGFKLTASAISFFEIIVWLLAITQIMRNLNNPVYYIAFAAGFSTGTFVGIWVENKLAMGSCILRIISAKMSEELIACFKQQGHGLTVIPGQGAFQPVKVIFMITKRKKINCILKNIKAIDPHAVYTIEDVRFVSTGIFPGLQPIHSKTKHHLFSFTRKGK